MNRVQEINFTPKAKRVLDVAKQACIEKKIAEISDDFLFYAVLKSDSMIVPYHESMPYFAIQRTVTLKSRKFQNSDG
jgi:hypothetical protein